jgi:hypothetical protein
MKSLRFLTIAIIILSISACTQGQMRKTVYGNNKVVTKERTVEHFTAIRVSTGIDVFLKQGNDEALSVEADENLQEYILTEVRGGVLNVYTEVSIRDAERKRVYVTMQEVNSIQTTSAGDVIAETPFKTERLELSASSAGNIKMEVYATDISLNISSSGDISLTGEADISVSSAGNAEINVSEKITARASSAGDINYQGNPKYVDAHSSSAGGVHKR